MVTQEIEAHLTYLDEKTRQELQRLKKARAEEMGTSEHQPVQKGAPIQWNCLSEVQKQAFLTICAASPPQKPESQTEKPNSPAKSDDGN